MDAIAIRLFYDLWDDSATGREFVESGEPQPPDRVSRSIARDVHFAMVRLNRIGHLIAEGSIEAGFVSSLVGKDVIRAVTRMRPFLEEERKGRSDSEYLPYLEQLFEVCKAAYPTYEPVYRSDDRRAIGLAP